VYNDIGVGKGRDNVAFYRIRNGVGLYEAHVIL
jgi:hypothetical protein